MEGSTQWQYPGSCHHTRNYSSLRQKDSAKHSRFIEGIVALKKGGGAGKLREQAHWWTLGRGFYQLCASGGNAGGWQPLRLWGGGISSTAHCNPSSPEGGTAIWWVEWLQNCAVGQHGCQLWLRLLFICLNHFLPQEIRRRGQWAGEQASRNKSPRHIHSVLTLKGRGRERDTAWGLCSLC